MQQGKKKKYSPQKEAVKGVSVWWVANKESKKGK
jgi:hypothetical protein